MGRAAVLFGRTFVLLLRDGVAALGTALVLLGGSSAALVRMLVRSDRFDRRQIAEAMGLTVAKAVVPAPRAGRKTVTAPVSVAA